MCWEYLRNCKHLTRFWMFLKRRVGVLTVMCSISFQNPAKNFKSGVDSRRETQVRGGIPLSQGSVCNLDVYRLYVPFPRVLYETLMYIDCMSPFPGFCMKP